MSVRIAMVGACPYPVAQGSQVLLRDTALALQERGHEVHLVVYGYGTGTDRSGLRIHRARNVPFAHRTAAGPSWAKPLQDLSLYRTLRRVVVEEKTQLVWAHNYEALLVALAVGVRPIVYHAHNAMADELPYFSRSHKVAKWLGRCLDELFPKRADCVIVPHRRLAGYLVLRGCQQNQIEIIPPFVNTAHFTSSRAEEELPPVVYTGNLDEYQNLTFLSGAIQRIKKIHPEVRLLLATADMERNIPGAERVKIRGFEELRQLLAQDMIFVVPRVSWSGYPIKLLNAMAAGKAVVACESAAYPLTHEGDGLVVPDNDEEAFADAVLRLLTDKALRARLGQNARKTVMAQHSPELVGAQLETIAAEWVRGRTDVIL